MAIPDVTNNTQQFISLAGSGARMLEADASGNLTASKTLVVAKLADGTAIALLVNIANWDANGAYIGTAITGTYEGQYYSDASYYFFAYSDNAWIRVPRIAGGGSGDMILANVQSVTGLKTFDATKLAMKGSSTGVNTIDSANTGASNYTNTLPAKGGTFAMTDDIPAATPSYFDATVGTGGDYSTIELALAANKFVLKMVADITLSSALVPATKLILYMPQGRVLRLASTDGSTAGISNTQIIGEAVSDGYGPGGTLASIRVERSGAGTMGSINNCQVSNVDIRWYTATNSAPIVTNSVLYNCYFSAHNSASKYLMGSNVIGYNIHIYGAGTSCSDVVTGSNIALYNLSVDGTWGSYAFNIDDITVYNLISTGSATNRFSTAKGTYYNVRGIGTHFAVGGNYYNSSIDVAGANTYTIKAYNCIINSQTTVAGTQVHYYENCTINCSVTVTSSGVFVMNNCTVGAYNVVLQCSNSTIHGNTMGGYLTSSADNNRITDNVLTSYISLGATADYNFVRGNKSTYITLTSGATYNIVTSNITASGIIDNSANLTNVLRDNI